MRIIDINTMAGPLADKLGYLDAKGLITRMDSYRISSCIAFSSTSVWSPARGNSKIKSEAEASGGRIRACYVLDPALGDLNVEAEGTLFDRLKADKPSAIKVFPNKGAFILDEFYCGEMLAVLDELHMPLLLDEDQIPPYERIPQLARAFPNIKFVMLRQGFKTSRYVMPLMGKLENVYFDTSIMLDTGIIEEIVGRFGSHKLVFGSGMPLYVPAGGLSLVLYADISDKDKENILASNWERIEGSISDGNQG